MLQKLVGGGDSVGVALTHIGHGVRGGLASQPHSDVRGATLVGRVAVHFQLVLIM